ncbi:MAG TPA: glycosyltransferase family A protein [Opitutaceae bacterium]|jgi:glycosyltransferase involved in cell wall biosynthesis|nr:glycosyltransferase family A protein [Opitutaceae bacterium]
MPKVSVLIPTYGYARFLPEAIESVLAQDFGDFELVISDDASPDASGEILRDFAARDPRIRAHVQPRNLGMVVNWNWCLAQARAPYVKFIFGDDRLNSRQALGRMAVALDTHPQVTMVASGRLILDEGSNSIEIWDALGTAGVKPGREVISRCLRADRNLIGEPSAVMFRRAAGARGFDPELRQIVDEEMWFHLLSAGDLAYVPDPLCAFRRHGNQQTVVNRESKVTSSESLVLLARYLDFLVQGNGQRLDPLAIRRLLFRYIYYSRKNTRRDDSRTPAVLQAEARLLARLTPRWYALCLLLHRVLKPLENLGRRIRPPAEPGRRTLPGSA